MKIVNVKIKKNKDADGIPKDGIPFHPYFTIKDSVVVVGFLWIFCAVVFYAPALNGYFLEAPNFIEANPLKTPEHIAPLWYLTPYYSVLRAIPPLFGSQFPGVLGMFAALGVLSKYLFIYLLASIDVFFVYLISFKLTANVLTSFIVLFFAIIPQYHSRQLHFSKHLQASVQSIPSWFLASYSYHQEIEQPVKYRLPVVEPEDRKQPQRPNG